jgi:hypothetical protein
MLIFIVGSFDLSLPIVSDLFLILPNYFFGIVVYYFIIYHIIYLIFYTDPLLDYNSRSIFLTVIISLIVITIFIIPNILLEDRIDGLVRYYDQSNNYLVKDGVVCKVYRIYSEIIECENLIKSGRVYIKLSDFNNYIMIDDRISTGSLLNILSPNITNDRNFYLESKANEILDITSVDEYNEIPVSNLCDPLDFEKFESYIIILPKIHYNKINYDIDKISYNSILVESFNHENYSYDEKELDIGYYINDFYTPLWLVGVDFQIKSTSEDLNLGEIMYVSDNSMFNQIHCSAE